jgi:hypothetical protein
MPFVRLIIFQMTDQYASDDFVSEVEGGYTMSMASVDAPTPVPAASAVQPVPLIRKKLTGFVGFSNLPNQVHRKSVRKGFQFTTMVVGACSVTTLSRVCSLVVRRVRSWKVHPGEHALRDYAIPEEAADGTERRAPSDGCY